MARKRIDFFLDMLKKDDRVVSRVVTKLKTQRAFSQAVKDGLMIMNELRQGKIDLLLKLHPWIVDKIQKQYPPPPPSNDELIEQFRKLLIEQGMANLPDTRDLGLPIMQPVAAPPLKQLSKGMNGHTVTFTAPTFDDDGSELVLKVASVNTGLAFADSLAKMGLFS